MSEYICTNPKGCCLHCDKCCGCTLFMICEYCDIRDQNKDEVACKACSFAKLRKDYEQEKKEREEKSDELAKEIIKRNKPRYYSDNKNGCIKRSN